MDGQAVSSRKRKRAGNSNASDNSAGNSPISLRLETDAKVRKVYSNNKLKCSATQVDEAVTANTTASEEMSEERKMHRIKLRSQDGKDLGHMNLFMKPEQAKTLNGKIIKLAKLNSIEQIKDNFANEKTFTYQLAPTRFDDSRVLTNDVSVARRKEILSNVHVSSRETLKTLKQQQDIALRTKDILKKNNQATAHNCGPKSTSTLATRIQLKADQVKSSMSKRNKPMTFMRNGRVILPCVEPRQYLHSFSKEATTTLVNKSSKPIIQSAKVKPVPQKQEVVIVESENPRVKKEIKIEGEILIDVAQSTSASRTCTEEQDPLADSVPSTDNKRYENNQEQRLRIIKHPIKRLADENPVLASFLETPSNSTPEENIIKAANSNPPKEENISVIQQAMDSISDKSLRDKALKALAECGLRVVRHLPIVPDDPTKTVCETETQTEVFGLLDENSFILAEEKSLELKRIPQRAQEVPKPRIDASIQVEPASFEPIIPDIPVVCIPDTSPLGSINFESFFNSWNTENSEISKVKSVLCKQDKRITETLAAQLRRDFDSIKVYDEDGMLGIHRAVVDNNLTEVRRLLFMLKSCQEDANVETAKGVTCLELAISSEASTEIVSALLKSGGTPISACLAHDSAIILASKQSSWHLRDLVAYVKDPFLLNLTGPEGFSALHYCAMLGNLEGVKILLDAGANLNMRDGRSGRTALFHAVENNHVKISALLYEKGATITTANFSGQTVLSLLQETTNSRLKKTFGQVINLGQRS